MTNEKTIIRIYETHGSRRWSYTPRAETIEQIYKDLIETQSQRSDSGMLPIAAPRWWVRNRLFDLALSHIFGKRARFVPSANDESIGWIHRHNSRAEGGIERLAGPVRIDIVHEYRGPHYINVCRTAEVRAGARWLRATAFITGEPRTDRGYEDEPATVWAHLRVDLDRDSENGRPCHYTGDDHIDFGYMPDGTLWHSGFAMPQFVEDREDEDGERWVTDEELDEIMHRFMNGIAGKLMEQAIDTAAEAAEADVAAYINAQPANE